VAHCGSTAIGLFGSTLTMTDLFTGWTENRASLGKKEDEILKLMKEIEEALPFALKGLSSDNGSELLNYGVLGYTKETRPQSLDSIMCK